MTKTYTQEEVDQLQKEWESDLFEHKTNVALSEIKIRLDQSNGYKETITTVWSVAPVAITRIDMKMNGSNVLAGSLFTLYGIP